MRSYRPHTAQLLGATTLLTLAYIVKSPLLPIRNDTKISWGYPVDSLLNFTELGTQYGYYTEEHQLVTEDGYILKLFRIRSKDCKEMKALPVILMHGLLQSSDTWLDAGPEDALGYLIADACHDLWLGNQRGNYYSRAHEQLNPDVHEEFWQFSVDEIGLYDIPSTIDYVLKTTKEKKLNYIGYSQGSGTFFIMCSERPEYCDKVQVFIGLAPASRQPHTKSVGFRAMIETFHKLSTVLSTIGVYEAFPKGAIGQELLAFLCQIPFVSNNLCDKFEAVIDSRHAGSISNDTTRVLFGHFPAGTSVQNMVRYRQSLLNDKFVKFDYGKEKNLQLYGTEDPPEYNLKAVSAPAVLIYGRSDYLVDPKDIEWLSKELPNVLETVEVKDPLWNHMDVPYSRYTKELVFPKVSKYLEKYSFR